ncbi:poly-gamma-glutamate hydrolase family protein [Priestia megaterium]|uniref:poly-gamma-glutamate hydrolase family protein n=1 Tax=Priestia megaterium TaxID=1404 RepID=UPI00366E0FC7
MSDKYKNFEELSEAEEYGVDYRIRFANRPSNIITMAIHGGGIETGTSEVAIGIAGDITSLYLFEGMKSSGNGDLHITSTNFDEPTALEMVSKADYAYSIHGYADSINKNTKIGGADKELKQKVYESLIAHGFSAEILEEGTALAGSDEENICNKTTRGMGVQLEISTAQRNVFFGKNTAADRQNTQTQEFYNYTQAIKNTIPF